jgi:Phage tail tube protein
MDTKGGRFSLEINGRTFSGRGEATINPSRVGIEANANMDGTAYRTTKPKLATLDLTFDRGVGLRWDEDLLLQEINVTFTEDDVGVTHFFTKASWVGDGAAINTATGEVSGLNIATASYQAV